MVQRIDVSAEVLNWAISRAGYSVPDISQKVPMIKDWLEGKSKPTVRQLEEFARKVHLPFGYLFLAEPPREKLPIPFFRSESNQASSVSLNVYDTVIDIQQRQDWLRDYLKENGYENLTIVGRFSKNKDTDTIVADIRQELGLEKLWAQQFKSWEDALQHLVQKIEDIGITLVFNGVVGNNTHRPIDVEECRGFVLVNDIAPFMFVNNADAKSAQLFTIIHELVHIWIGKSAGFDFRKLLPANHHIEQLCDKVAAEFLVPADTLPAVWEDSKDIRQTAQTFKVSNIVIARRLLDTGIIDKDYFLDFYRQYSNRINEQKDRQKDGGDFYATAKKRISPKFAKHVYHAVKTGQLLYQDAYKLTGLKGETFETFFSRIE